MKDYNNLLLKVKYLYAKIDYQGEEQFDLLNAESDSVDREIKSIEATYAWLMYTLDTDEQRKLLMTAYLKNLGVHFGKDTD